MAVCHGVKVSRCGGSVSGVDVSRWAMCQGVDVSR